MSFRLRRCSGKKIEEVIKERAIKKAKEQVDSASTHMPLEAQSLNAEQINFEIERIAFEMIQKMPPDVWNDA
ncbi:MAG: hypothetical protein V4629_09340 [Pseudomonadota bacterium]